MDADAYPAPSSCASSALSTEHAPAEYASAAAEPDSDALAHQAPGNSHAGMHSLLHRDGVLK